MKCSARPATSSRRARRGGAVRSHDPAAPLQDRGGRRQQPARDARRRRASRRPRHPLRARLRGERRRRHLAGRLRDPGMGRRSSASEAGRHRPDPRGRSSTKPNAMGSRPPRPPTAGRTLASRPRVVAAADPHANGFSRSARAIPIRSSTRNTPLATAMVHQGQAGGWPATASRSAASSSSRLEDRERPCPPPHLEQPPGQQQHEHGEHDGHHAGEPEPGTSSVHGLAIRERLQDGAGDATRSANPAAAQRAAWSVSTRRRNAIAEAGPAAGGPGAAARIREPRCSSLARQRARPRLREPHLQGAHVMQQGPRVVVIGLDCGTPKLLFDDLNAEVPTLAKLMARGHVRRSRVHHATHHGAGLGLRPHRQGPGSARHLRFPQPQGHHVRRPVHRALRFHPGTSGVGRARCAGKRTALIGVPPSFPPPKEFPGWRVGCFLTPPSAERWAFPQELETEIEEELEGPGNYIFDIPNFRQAGFDVTLDQVFKMTERRFQVGRRLLRNKPWDFFMLCDIALGPSAPCLLAVLRPAASPLRTGEQVRGRLPGLLPFPGQRDRRVPRARARRRRDHRDERPRCPSDDGWTLLQRLAR